MLAQPAIGADDPAGESPQFESSDFVPPNDGYDWLRLTSGEWLRGELIGAFDDDVEFDSVILDELKIDAEDVDQFHSQRVLGVSMRGYELMTGRVRVDGDDIFVFVDGEWLEFNRDQLIAVTVSAERERDRWSGDVGLGINVRRGNTEFIEYNMIAGVERRTPQSRVFVDYLGNFNETEGAQVAGTIRWHQLRYRGHIVDGLPVLVYGHIC